MKSYFVKAEWDAEAAVWYVAETGVPGLCTEASTADELFHKLNAMIPELLSLNGTEHQHVPFELTAHRASSQNHCH